MTVSREHGWDSTPTLRLKASKVRNPAEKIKLVDIDHYAGQRIRTNMYKQNERHVNPDENWFSNFHIQKTIYDV
jgi:hypothetical protein